MFINDHVAILPQKCVRKIAEFLNEYRPTAWQTQEVIMFNLIEETPAVAFNIARYCIAWTAAFDNYRHEFDSMYLTGARTALNAMRDSPPSPKDLPLLIRHNLELAMQIAVSSSGKMMEFHTEQLLDGVEALINTLIGRDGEKLTAFTAREADVMEDVAFDFPKAIENMKYEFGFQFESDGYKLVKETPCFKMYQVLPNKPGVVVNEKGKPTLLVPPYMLGVHILSFLPGEGRSYAHSFANQGIPTYVRVVKDIDITPAVQTMSCEDDCEQTRELCTVIKEKHGRQVTLNGICQGGYISLINVLSGKLQGVVDALITGVTPVDGTQSKSLGNFMGGMPSSMGMDYAYETLNNGNKVVNGDVMSLGMKLLAISKEAPVVAMYNAKALHKDTGGNPGKTAAAINRWLREERVHLPAAIAEMSGKTFKMPIAPDGTLPVELFGKPLNLHDLKKLGVRWYLAYSKDDALVDKDCALAAAPLLKNDNVLQVTEFPGGHVGILTSFASEKSKCPLHGTFNGMVGPVRFQLDLDKEPVNKELAKPAA
ncbi:MAG: metal transporter [Candidatus Competibacteraceae bacterium]